MQRLPLVLLLASLVADIVALVDLGTRDPLASGACGVAGALVLGEIARGWRREQNTLVAVLNLTQANAALLGQVARIIDPPPETSATPHVHDYVHRSTEWGRGMQRRIFVCRDPDCGHRYIVSTRDDIPLLEVAPPPSSTALGA